MSKDAIKSMELYSDVDRIHNELRQIGISESDPLDVPTLSQFDQYHYFGTDAVDEVIEVADIGKGSNVLEIGSGIGGPSRYLAYKTGCRVTAVELQPDLNELAVSLTARCGLDTQVQHICADVLSHSFDHGAYDAVVSWLCFYHIPDQPTLFSRCMELLRPGGVLCAEDLFRHDDFNEEEALHLTEMLYGLSVHLREDYCVNLSSAGFTDIDFVDQTCRWRPYVADRVSSWLANEERHVSVHGEVVFNNLSAFYNSVSLLFESGKLGGVRVKARKV